MERMSERFAAKLEERLRKRWPNLSEKVVQVRVGASDGADCTHVWAWRRLDINGVDTFMKVSRYYVGGVKSDDWLALEQHCLKVFDF